MTIEPRNEDWTEFEIASDSGNTYTVRFAGRPSPDSDARLWDCDCPAGRHGRHCRHIDAVADWVDTHADGASADSAGRPERSK